MSIRPEIRPYTVIPNAYGSPANGQSMAANITSAPTIIQKLSLISYGVSWTGTSPVGTLAVQVSNDYSLNAEGNVANAGTWNSLTLSVSGSSVTSIPISGNSGMGAIDITNTAFYAIRVLYTAGSGTGSLTVTINAKVS